MVSTACYVKALQYVEFLSYYYSISIAPLKDTILFSNQATIKVNSLKTRETDFHHQIANFANSVDLD